MFNIRRLASFIAFLFLFLGACTLYLFIVSNERIERDEKWVLHTYEVISNAHELLGHIRDSETGQRGFLLTMKEEYLEPFNSGVRISRVQYKNLKELTADNQKQQLRLIEISTLMERKFEELNLTISLAKSGNRVKTLAIVNSDLGKRLMDDLRTIFNDFIAEENILLERRKTSYENDKQRLRNIFASIALLLLTIIVFLIFFVDRKILYPISTLTKNAVNIGTGSYQQLHFSGNDEIGTLVQALNRMDTNITQKTNDLETANNTLKELSLLDGLTNIANRRHFDKQLEHEWKRSKRTLSPLSLIMIDVDYFKFFNDAYGHLAGDDCLQKLAKVISNIANRPSDLVARYGGEEFILILSETDFDGANLIAESIRLNFAGEGIHHKNSKVSEFVTFSAGLATFRDTSAFRSQLDLIKVVDEQLYLAKSQGRNRSAAIEVNL